MDAMDMGEGGSRRDPTLAGVARVTKSVRTGSTADTIFKAAASVQMLGGKVIRELTHHREQFLLVGLPLPLRISRVQEVLFCKVVQAAKGGENVKARKLTDTPNIQTTPSLSPYESHSPE